MSFSWPPLASPEDSKACQVLSHVFLYWISTMTLPGKLVSPILWMRTFELNEESDLSKVSTENTGRARTHSQVFSDLTLSGVFLWWSKPWRSKNSLWEMRHAAMEGTAEQQNLQNSENGRATPSPMKVFTVNTCPWTLCGWNLDKVGTLRFSRRSQKAGCSHQGIHTRVFVRRNLWLHPWECLPQFIIKLLAIIKLCSLELTFSWGTAIFSKNQPFVITPTQIT